MKLFRYRKPSFRTIIGATKVKKQIKKDLGITAITKPLRIKNNLNRRLLRKVGYYSKPATLYRQGLPKPLGCLLPLLGILISFILMIII